MKPRGINGARIPNCVDGPTDELAELPRQLAERILEAALELFAERHVPEAIPGVGAAVDERCPKDPARSGSSAYTTTNVTASAAMQPRTSRRRRQMTGSTARTKRPTGARAAASASGSRSPARTRRPRPRRKRSPGRRRTVGDRRRCCPVPPARTPGRTRASQATRSQSRIATSARWSACASAWVARLQAVGRQRHPEAGQHAEDRGAGQRPDEIDRDAGRDGDAQCGEQVHPERRLAERLEDDRGQPAEDDVGREAGRVGRAEQRRDGLELARCPRTRDPAGAPRRRPRTR